MNHATFVALCSVTILSTARAEDPPAQRPAPTFTARLLAVDTNEGCDVGDVNKDGVMDITAGRLWFAGPDFVPRPLRVLGEFGKDYSASNGEHLIDINGDGWLDVLSIGFHETQLNWYQNPGDEGLRFGKHWPQRTLVDTKQGSNEASWLRDMDGDGEADFIVNCWNGGGPMVYWKITRNEKLEAGVTRVVVAEKGSGHGQGYGDINGDGREDIVFGFGWYERPQGEAAAGEWKVHRDFNLPDASCPIVVTDVDGDGRNDMIWGRGHNYGLHWYQQLEPAADGKTQWKQHLIDKSWSQAHAIAYADLDGDGRSEIITGKRVRAHSGGDPGAGERPAIYFYRYDPATQSFQRHLIAQDAGTGLQIRVADMNGDMLPDIVTAGKNGTWLILQNPPASGDPAGRR